ncbi:hypothetical protein B7494_g7882 [Chlorociboria aeruginascens]|nr:hypothetical protein B7494_g7882 [Chlorociboria aeruginascens]
MTDLTLVLPSFPTTNYIRLIPSLEKHQITTADLLTLDFVEIAKRAQLPLLDVKRLCADVLAALRGDLGVKDEAEVEKGNEKANENGGLKKTGIEIVERWEVISLLDERIDQALGGGIPTGYITEIVGESGAGKTQFLLTLLLSAQLPPPHGLNAPTLYISTESSLPTTRLAQLLSSHPLLSSLPASSRPNLNDIHQVITADLETQSHILQFQTPVFIKRYGIRLLILDSVAANYRAEFELPGGISKGMAERSRELVSLGAWLREFARSENLAIVVANQVADRFSSNGNWNGDSGRLQRSPGLQRIRDEDQNPQSSPLAHRSGNVLHLPSSSIPQSSVSNPSPYLPQTSDPLSLDHQQRWFTGWGDDPHASSKNLKTPSLGLVWSTQIAMRIALIKRPVWGDGIQDEAGERGEPILRHWKRWMKVVFGPNVKGSGRGLDGAVEFEIRGDGVGSLVQDGKEGKG